MTRLTKRKRHILNVLSEEPFNGVALLNELRVSCSSEEIFKSHTEQSRDQRKSFNRTIMENFDELNVFNFSPSIGTPKNLTAGICARWIIWELIDHALLTAPPIEDEAYLMIGQNEGTVIARLGSGKHAVVGTSVYLADIVLVSKRKIDEITVNSISAVPWPLMGQIAGHVSSIKETDSIVHLDRLPANFVTQGGVRLSSSRKRFRYF